MAPPPGGVWVRQTEVQYVHARFGTLEKSQKCHEKSINTRYFVKNTDFQLLNGFDHVYEAIRT